MEPRSLLNSALATPVGLTVINSDEEQWTKIYFKHQKKSKKPTPQRPEFKKRMPLLIVLPMGPMQVCGKCLQLGHRAIECRHAITYLWCGEVGHKGLREGIMDQKRLLTTLRTTLNDNWHWSSKQFRDGRFIIECPLPEEAMEMEMASEIHLPKFSLSFEAWDTRLMVTKEGGGQEVLVARATSALVLLA
ncbi:hypothetical protein J5N97_020223 [Dioscorea zingiberensis]|uniref:CCHC-type domain-containing protein n=1 Tax=Dioscorea zingiberensis TaxID=325984 RepID=A0A9D5CFZ8_9LILI|nr:hypothetical protein J5N97_020223 [Dioscorea zingiberensis]